MQTHARNTHTIVSTVNSLDLKLKLTICRQPFRKYKTADCTLHITVLYLHYCYTEHDQVE